MSICSKAAAKTEIKMKDKIRGFIFCSLWYLSIIAGFFLLVCPILPLVIISPKKYRKWSDVIFGMWEPFPVAMMEVCFGIRVALSGDKINPFESSLFVMNHRTRVDWNFLWLGMFHCCQPNAHNLKYILKAPIMHFPGPGWVMQTCSFIFVHRNWARDKPLLNRIIDYLNESDDLYQILLFPEGTDLTDSNVEKSHKYADAHNLERYYKVLHPRTTGFAFIANKMKSSGQLKAIYDVTVAYPKTLPQNELDLLRGKFPEEVHFYVKRYNSSNIPCQEEDLKLWLEKLWKKKEQILQNFYSKGSFFSQENDVDPISKNDQDQGIDYGKVSLKNGTIKFDYGEVVNSDKNSKSKRMIDIATDSTTSVTNPTPVTATASLTPDAPALPDRSTHPQNHVVCEEVYCSKNYRPSHFLYLVLVFWISLILFTIHQLFYNFYLQIWVLIHSILFAALSLLSNGFHHVAASIYFYRYQRKPRIAKKSE